ncbi:MAG: tRNA (N(6)-L-threonylcarbamoyladenosine(37)-C(2))-methylthiotransferase [Candidatus Lokiarchaeota archaeon]|nr:tRNA (N(6)-L-threonylcarbamoyladenosine(37)-C(2))-methylthiotransferase [Candidatus Lokiarchaeota archaeon]
MENKTYYIETYGCTSNKADSLIISSVLNKAGYSQKKLEDAEFVLINTCAVKQQTENKIKTRLKDLYNRYKEEENKYFVIAGCLPHIDSNYIDVIKKIIPNFSAIIDLDNLEEIPVILRDIKSGKKNLIIKSKGASDKSRFLIDYPKDKITGIVPISSGCLGSCTYCCVKNARGHLNCYEPKSIIENIKHQLKQGIKQIYLTSQDCSTYMSNNMRLVDLIQEIGNLDFKFFLRIGMLNPKFIVDNFDQLISMFKFDKVYQFLHIPIQSGSDAVLKKMNRPYTISDITEKLKILRKEFPFITISTDIICGFPGETEDDFAQTNDLIKWLNPEILNISQYTARPGTKAKEMKQINSRIIKERSIRLTEIFRESMVTINEKWQDWEGEILLLHKGTTSNQAFGRNFAYKNIFLENNKKKYGSFVRIQIYDIDGFNLFAKLI